MVTGSCPDCRLVWGEDRGLADNPPHKLMGVCPRCGYDGQMNAPLRNPHMPIVAEPFHITRVDKLEDAEGE